jgi:hypothetical protein
MLIGVGVKKYNGLKFNGYKVFTSMDKYHLPHMFNSSLKPSTPQSFPSKTLIINWLRSLFVDLPQVLKIEDLGTGVIYCRVINHYYPNTIPLNRIVFHPKN